ncbi:MAG: rhomboid family intramembrane serine protease [Bacilli bacterium]|nr:rhomboid family intramembrane serine protease [Bacilli bacterium]
MSIKVDTKDEIIMRLVHYFVTVEDYQPIIVNGVKNEIWLENITAPYRIVRINSNYIHNEEQLKFDNFKVKNIAKQIKKKTLSFKVNTLNILLDLNEDVNINDDKDINTYKVANLKDVRKEEGLAKLYPKLKTFMTKKGNNLDFIVNITNDINEKTEKDNRSYEKVFKPKKIVVTKVLIAINISMFILTILFPIFQSLFILSPSAVKTGEIWRLITAAFLHGDFIHLLVNMYSLNIIGTQIETFLGRSKYLAIYLGSAITGSLLSCVITNSLSLGASGAIFGLLGSIAYFGYHYRIYLGSVLKSQILPVIVINLLIGFMMPFIDNAGHIGGLFGGLFITMALGIGHKDDKTNRINGVIITIIYLIFLSYLLFLR